jgi:predicted transcriptional regulator
MEVHFTPELERKLNELATQSGRGAQELVQDAVAGYVDELAATREMLDARYEDMKSGRVQPIDGETFFESLRKREDKLVKPRTR